ncbi:MAG: DUF3494 domain-containing protein [Acidobacteria bacterium]|nr:DUF3494 domain-containing protein [Acidobacteriota bacterium]
MRHTHSLTRNLTISTLRHIKGWHLLLAATIVLLASTGFAAFLYGHASAFAGPSLGTAQSFAVLGGSTVTNTGSTVVTGDMGVWPGLAITGFPPGVVNPPGTIHTGDAVAQQAQNDVTTAYNTLAGMACNTSLTGQDLGGLTLTPGVYCFSSSAQLTGSLTLDALGDPDAVFIFQIGSSLTTASNASVQVINAGQNCNVFWQVGSSATLGTSTDFVGNILALTSITLNTTATLSGRALARNGAVTMDTNTITASNCALCPPINTTITAPAAVCELSTGNTASVPDAGAGATYNWTITGGTITAGQGTRNITFTAGTTGPVTLNVTVTTPGCSANGSAQVTINANPTAVAGIDQTLCQTLPGPTDFTVTGTASGGTPSWSVVGSTGTAVATIVSPNAAVTAVNVAGIGTVTLRLTTTSNATPGCGTATDDIVLTVTTSATALAGEDQSLCQTMTGPTVFTVNGTGGTPSWSVVGSTGTAAATIVSPNSATTAVNITGNGTVTLRLTTTGTCGTATDDVVLTVYPKATAAAGVDQSLCQVANGPTAFTVTGTFTDGSPATPAWSVVASTGMAAATIVSPNSAATGVNITGAGTVTLRFTVNSNSLPACGATDDVVLTVTPLPVATITAPTAVCELSTGNTASVPDAGAGATYNWMITGGTITAGQGTRTITWTAGNTGSVTISVTVTTAAGCSANGSAQVTINANPTAAAGVDQTLCQTLPGPTDFTVTGTASGGTPSWSVVSSTGTAAATIVSPNSATTAVNITGVGTVTLRLTTTGTCGIATDDVVLTVYPKATAAAGVDQSLCQVANGPTAFTVTGTFTDGSPATPAWTVVASTGTAAATIVSPNTATTGVNITGVGTVTLRFTVNSNSFPACGATGDDVVLTVTPLPVATITAPAVICELSTGNTASVPDAGAGATYNWMITGGTITAGQGTRNITWTAGNTGSVTISVTVTTAAGCSANGSAQVTINANPTAAAALIKRYARRFPDQRSSPSLARRPAARQVGASSAQPARQRRPLFPQIVRRPQSTLRASAR